MDPRPAPDQDRERAFRTHVVPQLELLRAMALRLTLERIADPALVEALQGLSADHQSVVALVDIDGLSYQEAAEPLDIPVGTVMSRLHRARRRLRASLERAGHFEEVQQR